jgi:hypothetical protein
MLEAVLPLALIPITVLPLMYPIAVGFAVLPLTDVRVPEDPAPHTVALLDTVAPLPVIHFSVRPEIDPLAMSLPGLELTLIAVPVRVPFIALALSEIVLPLALVDTILPIEHDTQAVTFPVLEVPAIERIRIFLQAKVLTLPQHCVVKHLTLHIVFFDHLLGAGLRFGIGYLTGRLCRI